MHPFGVLIGRKCYSDSDRHTLDLSQSGWISAMVQFTKVQHLSTWELMAGQRKLKYPSPSQTKKGPGLRFWYIKEEVKRMSSSFCTFREREFIVSP